MNRESRFLETVRKWIEIHGRITEVSKEASPTDDKTWLSRALRGQRPFTFEHLSWVLTALGTEETQFWEFHAAEVGIALSPTRSLRAFLNEAVAADRSQHQILSRLDEVLPLPLPTQFFDDVPERVATIRHHRQRHRQIALAEAETWLHEMWSHGLKVKRWSPARTSELCSALGAWAAVRRSLGDPSGAATALNLAFGLHASAPYSPTYADLLETAALVARDLGSVSVGYGCLQQALSIYSVAEDDVGWLRTMMTLGVFARYMSLPTIAEKALMQCVRHPRAEPQDRAAAISNLAWVWLRFDRANEAAVLMESFEPEIGCLPDRYRFNIDWVRAQVDLAAGLRLGQTADRLEELLNTMTGFLEPADCILLFLDFADCVTRLGQQHRLSPWRPQVARIADTLDRTPLAQRIVGEFLADLGQGALPANQLQAFAARFKNSIRSGGEAASFSS